MDPDEIVDRVQFIRSYAEMACEWAEKDEWKRLKNELEIIENQTRHARYRLNEMLQHHIDGSHLKALD